MFFSPLMDIQKWVLLQVLNKVEIDLSTTSSTKSQQPDIRTHLLVLQYKGIRGEHPLKHIKREINKVLPEEKNMPLAYTETKLGTKFNVKDKTKKEHHDGLTYSVKCPMKNCLQSYNGETGRRLIERVNEYSGKDIDSHMFQHSMAANHPTVTLDDFTVLSSGYHNRKFKGKVSESLFIKQKSPTVNKCGTSIPLKLFN